MLSTAHLLHGHIGMQAQLLPEIHLFLLTIFVTRLFENWFIEEFSRQFGCFKTGRVLKIKIGLPGNCTASSLLQTTEVRGSG